MAQQIPEEDLVAVRTYITDFYPPIDSALRAIDMPKLQEYDAHIRVATFGLYELPAYRGPVFRGTTLPEALVARYVLGTVIQERAFVACSANPACRFPGTFNMSSSRSMAGWSACWPTSPKISKWSSSHRRASKCSR